MAKKTKRPAKYDLKAGERRRNILIQVGLTAIVLVFAVGLVLYIVMSNADKPKAGDARAIRVSSQKLIKKDGSDEPKAVITVAEDFLCPACGNFEKIFGPTVNQIIDTGAAAVDYNMVAILDRPQNQNYSSRSGGAGYCVADKSIDAFRVFHSALYAQQPSETGSVFPDNAQLVESARLAGAGGDDVAECINSGRYVSMVEGMAAAVGVKATPTIRINGEDYKPTTPDALVDKIKSIVGDVPGLAAPAQEPAAS